MHLRGHGRGAARGRWTHLLTGERVEGPTWVRRTVPLDELPIYLRNESALPLGEAMAFVGERPIAGYHLHLFAEGSARFRLRDEETDAALVADTTGGVTQFRVTAGAATAGSAKGLPSNAGATMATRAATDGRPGGLSWILHIHHAGRPKRIRSGATIGAAGWRLIAGASSKWWLDADGVIVRVDGDDCTVEW